MWYGCVGVCGCGGGVCMLTLDDRTFYHVVWDRTFYHVVWVCGCGGGGCILTLDDRTFLLIFICELF